jgi:hypothetical protein
MTQVPFPYRGTSSAMIQSYSPPLVNFHCSGFSPVDLLHHFLSALQVLGIVRVLRRPRPTPVSYLLALTLFVPRSPVEVRR